MIELDRIIDEHNGQVSFWREIEHGAWQHEPDTDQATHYCPHGEIWPRRIYDNQ